MSAQDTKLLEGKVGHKEGGDPVLLGGGELYDESGMEPTKGVYASWPGATPKYFPSAGRDVGDDLTVARLYLTGAGEGLDSTDFGLWQGAGSEAATLFNQGYVGFLLQQVTEEHAEKTQILPLNGDGYAAYFMGQHPVTYSFSGFLLNTRQDQWRRLFSDLYDKVFRGSKVAAHRHMVQVAYDQQVVTGVMTDMVQVLEAKFEMYSQFQFSLLVKDVFREAPSFDIVASAFIGNKDDFGAAGLRVPDAESVVNYTKSVFISPPPRPKREGNATSGCSASLRNVAFKSGERLNTIGVIKVAAKCATAGNLKMMNKKYASLKKRLGKVKGAKLTKLESQMDSLSAVIGAVNHQVKQQVRDRVRGVSDKKSAAQGPVGGGMPEDGRDVL